MSVNGMYIVQGEMTQVVMALRRSRRRLGVVSTAHGHHDPAGSNSALDEHDPLLRGFADLRDVLYSVCDLSDVRPAAYLSPFLEVIQSDDTSGPVTGLSLMAISKFLSYGLVDPGTFTAPSAVEQVAFAVTRARFVGANDASDEVVLMKILHVLRTLLLTRVGSLLTNPMAVDILQSCFRIFLEPKLSELLRRAAEFTLSDMIQLIFTRLPTFREDLNDPYIRKMRMRANFNTGELKRRKKHYRHKKPKPLPPSETEPVAKSIETIPEEGNPENPENEVSPGQVSTKFDGDDAAASGNEEGDPGKTRDRDHSITVVNFHENVIPQEVLSEGGMSDEEVFSTSSPKEKQKEVTFEEENPDKSPQTQTEQAESPDSHNVEPSQSKETSPDSNVGEEQGSEKGEEEPKAAKKKKESLEPYGLPCIQELFRFLIDLANPLDQQNTASTIQMALSLVTVALEAGADYLGNYTLLMPLVKNELCRNLLALLPTDRMPLFAATLRTCFILFEALRTHLKLQLECYLVKLMELVVSEHPKVSFEQKEMALEALVQLWCIPGLVTELYLNYDCDLYCSNLFEDLTKLLSKNSFPVAGIYSTHILSLDALLSVVDTIEKNCSARTAILNEQERASRAKEEAARDATRGAALGSPRRAPQTVPTASGLAAAKIQSGDVSDPGLMGSYDDIPPQARPNRMPIASNLPTHEDLVVKKKRKRILWTGTDLFNQSPSKGISYLQEHDLLATPLDPQQAVAWIRENPRLDKKQIGEWVANRKNSAALKAFVHSFNFEGVRIDDALRAFLETFRLVGEAPVISMIMEHFAEHWSTQNGDPFVNQDAAFTLAFAVIMLNTDQHNLNVRKQNEPMTVSKFRQNLKGVNGGEDFNEEYLNDIFDAIAKEEIVMPEEHAGQVREAYLWKVLLHRSETRDGVFLHAPPGLYDHDLFSLIWGPTVAAIAFVFDKTTDDSPHITKCMNGFWKCADIAAHYGMSDVFDNQIISLCKFSALMSLAATPDHPNWERDLCVAFGESQKAQMAARAMFELVHKHGDILREGWKNILECLLQLYRAHLLPSSLTEVADFVDQKGWVSIAPERILKPKEESGLFSSLYTLLGSSSDVKEVRQQSAEDQEHVKTTQQVITECKPEQIIADSRYLTAEALSELLKAIAVVSTAYLSTDLHGAIPELHQNYVTFLMELLVNVTLENKDRVAPHWKAVKGHLHRLMTVRSPFIVERTVVNLIRLVSRLLFREEIAEEVLRSLSMILGLPVRTFKELACQLSFGFFQLLKTNAADIHKKADWQLMFLLLEVSGAAAFPNNVASVASTGASPSRQPSRDGDGHTHNSPSCTPGEEERGYISDSELYLRRQGSPEGQLGSSPQSGSAEWAHVNEHGELVTPEPGNANGGEEKDPFLLHFNPEALTLRKELHRHNPKAFLKSCETLAFLVRDAAHITPENFESCLGCLRTFTEASIHGGRSAAASMPSLKSDGELHRIAAAQAQKSNQRKRAKKGGDPAVHDPQRTEEEMRLQDSYLQVSLQLLDLTHTLHVKAADIYSRWKTAMPDLDTSSPSVWKRCWLPCLQCLAKSCTDVRKQVRTTALTYLQRSLLIHDLQSLEPAQWEECFTGILFPLLAHLRCNITSQNEDFMGIEEARCRSLALLCKVFLQHLNPLLALPNFTALWVTIVDFNRQFYQPEKGDVLLEAIPESLKNMLLVMDTAGIFATCPNLYQLTASRLEAFLPNLMAEIFPEGRSTLDDDSPSSAEPLNTPAPSLPEGTGTRLVTSDLGGPVAVVSGSGNEGSPATPEPRGTSAVTPPEPKGGTPPVAESGTPPESGAVGEKTTATSRVTSDPADPDRVTSDTRSVLAEQQHVTSDAGRRVTSDLGSVAGQPTAEEEYILEEVVVVPPIDRPFEAPLPSQVE